jgi:predicted neuraminidase
MRIISREFLPTTTPSVHAATMAFFKGHPVYAWFAGSREGAADVAIHLYNLNNDKKIIIIGGNDGIPRWNPVLMPINDKLFLFTKAGLFCDRWTTYIHNITTWPNDITNKEIVNTANMLPAGLNGPVKTRPIIKANTIWCGSSTETIYDWTSWIEQYRYDGRNFAYEGRSNPLFLKDKKIYQDFNGVTRSSLGVIQPSLWIDKNDKMK